MKVCAREARIGKGERRQANKAEQVRITVSLVGWGLGTRHQPVGARIQWCKDSRGGCTWMI